MALNLTSTPRLTPQGVKAIADMRLTGLQAQILLTLLVTLPQGGGVVSMRQLERTTKASPRGVYLALGKLMAGKEPLVYRDGGEKAKPSSAAWRRRQKHYELNPRFFEYG